MDLKEYRGKIDEIDQKLVALFAERMDVAAGIAAYKKEHGLPVLDPARERAKLLDVAEKTPEALQEYAVSLYSLLFELSRSYQNRLLGKPSALTEEIRAAEALPGEGGGGLPGRGGGLFAAGVRQAVPAGKRAVFQLL